MSISVPGMGSRALPVTNCMRRKRKGEREGEREGERKREREKEREREGKKEGRGEGKEGTVSRAS